jgi:hypothetical protein
MNHYPGCDDDQPNENPKPKEKTTMNVDRFFDVMRGIAGEIDIPFERLMQMRHSELQPIFEFVKLKRDLRIAANQKERDRLKAEQQQWLDMHPLWRQHLEAKQAR